MNRQGKLGNAMLYSVLFFLFLIVGAGISAGVFIFFGSGYDSRQADSDSLAYSVSLCLKENSVNFNDLDSFYKICKLDRASMENYFMLKICSGNVECVDNDVPGLVNIGSNFPSCKFEGRNDAYPRCSLTTINQAGTIYQIVAGSKQTSRRING